MSSTHYENFLTTYSCRELLKKHTLDEVGLWRIDGEDPNCDFGGHHSNPHLCYLQGKLEDVIKEAVELDRFWTWGAGGNITKVKARKISSSSIERRRKLNEEYIKLQERLEEIEKQLGEDDETFE